MKNILVFPAGSEIGLEIHRSFKYSKHFRLYGASSVDDHARFAFENYIPGMPQYGEESLIDRINEVVSKYQIEFIFPAHDSIVLYFAQNQHRLLAEVVTSPLNTCMLTRSKRSTYDLLSNSIVVPRQFKFNDDIKFPVFLKPDIGQGSRGVYKAHNREELEFYIKRDDSLLILEYLPGEEFTIDCFTDRKGDLLFSEGRKRNRISNGISVNSYPVSNKTFTEIARKINSMLVFRGAWFFQLKINSDNELSLLEVSPRISGTMALFRCNGVNFAELSVYDRMGIDCNIITNDSYIEVDRALKSKFKLDLDYKVLYIDFDDTIIVDEKINPEAMNLLYQEKGKGKEIILITKHSKDIYETLEKYKIHVGIFNKIIHLDADQKKYSHMTHEMAIFVDDSFSERKEVKKNLNIPVFSIDSIECLLD